MILDAYLAVQRPIIISRLTGRREIAFATHVFLFFALKNPLKHFVTKLQNI